MATARSRHEWAQTSGLLCLIANAHRDPKRTGPFKPSHFDPHAKPSDERIPGSVRDLKRLFVDPRRPHGGREPCADSDSPD